MDGRVHHYIVSDCESQHDNVQKLKDAVGVVSEQLVN